MNRILQQLNRKTQNKLKANLKQTASQWYAEGVKENMKFMKWLGHLQEELK